MPTFDDIARSQTSLTPADRTWLQALVADWQIIADLAFSDLVLWVPDGEATGMWAVAQIRPTTGPTTLLEDVTGTFEPTGSTHALQRALHGTGGEVVQDDVVAGAPDVHVRLAPVRRAGRAVAVVALRSSASGLRAASHLESTYRRSADELVRMIGDGAFPVVDTRSELADSLRVGDGFVRVDTRGRVEYASPNAMSAYRRLGVTGDLVGAGLVAVTTALVGRRPTDQSARTLLADLRAGETEVENSAASLLVRVIPLSRLERSLGAVVLLRDVTELRLRERELVSKEATIREIHHRVKNNLQTVAALLRLQARRMDVPEARAALEEAVQRVGSIALVHETLSQSFDEHVDFDDIADRLLRTVLDVGGPGVRGERIGTFGSVSAEVATPLAMVLTELIQNAAEHAYGDGGGRITVAANRIRDRLRLRVGDEGVGLPADFRPTQSLGLSIVTTLVETELGGTLAFESRSGRGTTVAITLTL